MSATDSRTQIPAQSLLPFNQTGSTVPILGVIRDLLRAALQIPCRYERSAPVQLRSQTASKTEILSDCLPERVHCSRIPNSESHARSSPFLHLCLSERLHHPPSARKPDSPH